MEEIKEEKPLEIQENPVIKRGRGRPKGAICKFKVGRYGVFTKEMEKFCHLVAEDGYTYIEAVKKVYPKIAVKSYTQIAKMSAKLKNNPDIVRRLRELEEERQKLLSEENDKLEQWTRSNAIRDLKYLENLAVKEIQRVEEGREEQLNIYEEMLDEEIQKEAPSIIKIREYREKISNIKQKRTVSSTQVIAVKSAVEQLNIMHGFNEFNVNNNLNATGDINISFDYGDDDQGESNNSTNTN